MTLQQQIITVAMCVLGTVLTRFLPFVVFAGRPTPKYIQYLGKLLPGAVFSMLVIYCLKDAVFTAWHGLPELLAMAVVVLLHRRKKNVLLSLVSGTVLYMLLVQFVF